MTDSTFGKAEDYQQFICEKCHARIYLNEHYFGLVLCESCMDKEFPD